MLLAGPAGRLGGKAIAPAVDAIVKGLGERLGPTVAAAARKVIEHVTIVGTTFSNGPITITDNVAGVFSQVSGFVPSGSPQYIARVEFVNRILKCIVFRQWLRQSVI
jgi:hypothetical protein